LRPLQHLQLVAYGQHFKVQRSARPRHTSEGNRSENSTEVIAEKRIRGWPQHQGRQQERLFQ
jgi:hypothetical protein